MKALVSTKALKSAKPVLSKVVHYGTGNNNLILRAVQDRLILHQSTHYNCNISLFLDAEVSEQGQVEISKDLLYTLLSSLESQTVCIATSNQSVPFIYQDDNEFIIYAPKSSTVLQEQHIEGYSAELNRSFYDVFSRSESVLECASYLEQRPVDGLHISSNNAIATNGYQMYFSIVNGLSEPVTIPTAIVQILVKIWKNGSLRISYNSDIVRIDHDTFSMTFPSIKKYPPYENLIPSEYLANVVITADLLIPALKEYHKLGDKEASILFRDDCIIIEHKEMPPLYLSAQVNGEYDIRLNISRFYEGIAKMKGSLWLAISNKELYDGKHAIVVREMGNPDFLYMQVPLLA